MYDTLTDFLKSFSVDHPALWALLVMAVVACTSLGLFVFWEVILRLATTTSLMPKIKRRRPR